MRIGCLGLSANPPHLGHLDMARVIRNSGLLVDAVWLIPTFEHPFAKEDMASWHDRVNMSRFLEDISLDISVSVAEGEMADPRNCIVYDSNHSTYSSIVTNAFPELLNISPIKRSYTIDTLRYLRAKHQNFKFFWCLSSDIIVSGSYRDWHRWDELEKEEMILVVERPGYPLAKDGLPKPFRFAGIGRKDTSSTEIRRMAKDGQDITPYVGPEIAEYIRKRKLYTS